MPEQQSVIDQAVTCCSAEFDGTATSLKDRNSWKYI
jgi:hypothetical protein